MSAGPRVISFFILLPEPRVFDPDTEHKSLFSVADSLYAADRSMRNKKTQAQRSF